MLCKTALNCWPMFFIFQKFQPPTIQDSAILSFYQNSSDPSSIRRITPATTVQTANSDIREKGFIDKCQVWKLRITSSLSAVLHYGCVCYSQFFMKILCFVVVVSVVC